LLGENGIEHIYELELTKDELAALNNSCEILRSSFATIQ
jgi:malate/lactate dehydrogenase